MSKKKDAGPAPEETQAANGPIKQFRVDGVAASVFARDRSERTFYSVSLTRAYQDASGQWKYSKVFDAEDLGKVVSVVQQAADYVQKL